MTKYGDRSKQNILCRKRRGMMTICLCLIVTASLSAHGLDTTATQSASQKTSKGIKQPNAIPKTMNRDELSAYILKRWQELPPNKPPYEATIRGLYDSFKFNSTTAAGTLFNKYSGASKLVDAGATNLVYHGYNMGLTVSYADTSLNSNSLFIASLPSNNSTTIHNTAINGHVRHLLYKMISLEIFGGVGYSVFDIATTLVSGAPLNGSGNLHGWNEYVGPRLYYTKSYRRVSWLANLSYVFSNFEQSAYAINYSNGGSTPVVALTTQIGLLAENAQVSYQVNDNLLPFLEAGLVQVVDRYYSSPLTVVSTASSIPQLILGNNGYRLAAGVIIHKKHIRVTPYYQYSQRGSNYYDNMGMIKIDYLFY